MESYEAEITTDFSNWGEIASGGWGDWGMGRRVRQVLDRPLALSPARLLAEVGLIAALMGLMTLILLHRDNKKLYGAFVTAVIVSMVLGPLMQSHQVYAFSEQQQATVSDYQQAQEEQQALEEAETALTEKEFDPSVNPLNTPLNPPRIPEHSGSYQPTTPQTH
jgi:hypothetical protein